MKTVIDGTNRIYTQLKNGGIKAIINGEIYKDQRPSGSLLEDIVINSLPMDNGFLQDGVFNVNCYVPFKSITIGGVKQYVRNNSRLDVISSEVYSLLSNIYGEDYNMSVEYHQIFDEPSENTSFISFRVQMNLYN